MEIKMKKKKVMLDHYEVLGLPTGEKATKLTEKEITKAYRTKALQLHPDKRPNDPDANAKFQGLNSSYELLRDPKSRKQFDSSLIRLANNPPEPKRKSPEAKREPPKPKRESPEPKPKDEPPSEPNKDDDDECPEHDLYLIGLLVVIFAPMVFPVARSQLSTVIRLWCFTTGFDILTKRQESEYWEIWTTIVAVGQFFKRIFPRAADNQESQGDDHEDIEDWVMV